jgi:beta-barrel assembly-enhancing protease
MNRRRALLRGCAHCAAFAAPLFYGAAAQAQPDASWAMPPRFGRPDLASDEGGLWALMDREETRLRRSPFRMRDEGLQEYLQGLACKLAGEHCADIRVYPLRTPFFNASMAPNGMMQVWSGLLLRADNEAQLCAVLAHEVGHFMQRHTLAQLRDVRSRSAFGVFLAMFGVIGLLGAVAATAGSFGFSRDQEREADLIGLRLMEQAGYDPREAAKVWDNLIAERAANPAADNSAGTPMFATHPNSAERARTLAERAEGRGGETGEAAYRARLAPLRFGLLADELKRGQYGESLVLIERLLARQTSDVELLYYRGETRRLRGDDGDAALALIDLQAAVAGGNEPAAAHRSLAYLHRAQGRSAEARRAFETYLAKVPDAADAALIRQYLSESTPS